MTAPDFDPIRPVEEALNEARKRIAKMRKDNFITIVAAHDSVVLVGERIVDAFRVLESRKEPKP